MHENLLKQIIKLESYADMVKAECVKTREMMEKPVSQRFVNKQKRLAIKGAELMKRLVKQS